MEKQFARWVIYLYMFIVRGWTRIVINGSFGELNIVSNRLRIIFRFHRCDLNMLNSIPHREMVV